MAKLGSKINMTAANIYNYYTNKDELLIAIHKKTYPCCTVKFAMP